MKYTMFALLASLTISVSVIESSYATNDQSSAQPTGKIRICRSPPIQELMDGKPVPIPENGTYTGKCDSSGSHCRFSVEIGVLEPATLPANMKSCLILPAKLIKGDGNPIPVGMKLASQWNLSGFTPSVIVVQEFK